MNLIEKLAEFCSKDLRLRSSTTKKTISAGPWGSKEGYDWRFNVDGTATITSIGVNFGQVIDAITIHYELDGVSDSAKFGCHDGSYVQFDLDWPKEYLTSIRGLYSTWSDGLVRLRWLRFVSNVREYGPFGPESTYSPNPVYFELPLKGGMILGFHGKMDKYLNSIGVYMKPC